MKRQQQGTKSGFAESRNAVAHGKNKKPATREDRRLAKIQKAKEELGNILAEAADEAVPPPPGAKLKKSATRFGDEINKVRRVVSNSTDDFNASAANRRLLRAILATTLDLIPQAEKNYRREGKEQQGYVYVALCNQATTLATDLNQMSDAENQSKFISESILHPFFISITQNMLQELMTLKSVVDTQLSESPKRALKIKTRVDDTMRTMGEFFTQAHIKASGNIQSYLNGDMSFVEGAAQEQPTKRRKRR